ncbi:hypothetical protein PENSPDRAFT_37108 [Peniophora sp. CONT]|nr:hypothetical protein PENSPDRAFT_37108 [Peniophora sp. CONT]
MILVPRTFNACCSVASCQRRGLPVRLDATESSYPDARENNLRVVNSQSGVKSWRSSRCRYYCYTVSRYCN